MKVAVLGLGFMGTTHVKAWHRVAGAVLAAVESRDSRKLEGDFAGVAGNLGGASERVDLVERSAQPQPDVGRDLVVARAPGVQPLSRLADQIGEALFDVEMNVLQIDRPGEAGGLDLALDLLHAALDVLQVLV